jgi:hypothetical protein
VRTAVLDNLWLADLTQMQATYACPRADQGGFQCLLIQGRCPAEYLALLPSHGSCNYECKEWQALRDGFAIGSENGLSVRTCACMHCGRAQSDTMVAAVHRMLQCRHGVERCQFRIRILGMDWDASRMPWCCPFCHRWEDKPSRETKVLYWNAVATLFRPLAEACRILRMTRTTALVLKILRATY